MRIPIETLEHLIGRFGGQQPGPLIVTIGGLHGNEPAGVAAGRRVLDKLQKWKPRFRGEYVALAGNISALKLGRRYVDEDLNRVWLPARLRRLAAGESATRSVEAAEQYELLIQIDAVLKRSGSEVYFLDLHTTSAPGSAFSVFGDTLHNRRLAAVLPCPMVLGLEEFLEGTLLNYINELGYAAVGLEGGQHEALSSVSMHELAIWQAFVATGCLAPADIPDSQQLKTMAEPQQQNLPRLVEVRYRHDIVPDEGFIMEKGFQNLDKVRRGDLLARDEHGEIRSFETGYVLMPLYQSQGSDGFFLVRKVSPFWLRVSSWLRALRLGDLLPFLPGVQRRGEDTVLVNSKIARWFVVEIFHLLGFRRQRPEGRIQVFTRRRETHE